MDIPFLKYRLVGIGPLNKKGLRLVKIYYLHYSVEVGIGPLNKKGLRPIHLLLTFLLYLPVGIGPLNKKGLRHHLED